MTLLVLELNDQGIRIGDESGLRASSPGYVVAAGKELVFGEEAAALSRIHPVTTSSEFWHRLGMDPLPRQIAHFRHNADIAHAHLTRLTEQHQLQGDVILAVPGSYTREQLALLLGLLRHSPLRPAALMDTALAAGAAASAREAQWMIHLDMHLHQSVLSALRRSNGQLRREAVVQIPGLGWMALADALVQQITDAFIRQCRFNPLHNARWEQAMYDSLPRWLGQESDADNNLQLEIDTGTTLHKAKLTRASIIARLQPFYRRMEQHLLPLQMESGQGELLLSERLASLPGLRPSLGSASVLAQQVVDSDAVMQACLRQRETLCSDNEALSFRSTLQLDTPPAQARSPVPTQAPLPSHVLLGHQAWALGSGLHITVDETRQPALQVERELSAGTARPMAEIIADGSQFMLRCLGPGWTRNGSPAQSEQILHSGDVLSLAGIDQPLQLIRVHDGQS